LISMNVLQPDAGQRGELSNASVEAPELPRLELLDKPVTLDSDSFWQPEQDPDQALDQPLDQAIEPEPEPGPEPEPQADTSDFAAVQSAPASCVRLGPFESESELLSLRPELESWFEQVHMRQTETMVKKGYWVFLPPYETREQAEQVLERLTTAGVKDYYVMPNGNMENAISLGLFDLKERAEDRQRQLMELGLELEIGVELQSSLASQYWLEAGPVAGPSPDLGPDLSQWSLSHPSALQMQIPCSTLVAETQVLVRESDSVPEIEPSANSLLD